MQHTTVQNFYRINTALNSLTERKFFPQNFEAKYLFENQAHGFPTWPTLCSKSKATMCKIKKDVRLTSIIFLIPPIDYSHFSPNSYLHKTFSFGFADPRSIQTCAINQLSKKMSVFLPTLESVFNVQTFLSVNNLPTNNVGIFPDFTSRISNKKDGRPYTKIFLEHTHFFPPNLLAPPTNLLCL